ncbi:hypothetical protein D3C73_1338040 [compost metagenome]
MQRPEGRVTVTHRIHQDAHTHEVVDVVEVLIPDDHLLVNRVVVLRTARDGRLDACRPQVIRYLVTDDAEALFPLRRPVSHHAYDFLIHLGVQRSEGKIFQFPLDGIHAQAMGQGCEDLQCFAGLAR